MLHIILNNKDKTKLKPKLFLNLYSKNEIYWRNYYFKPSL